MDIKTALSTSVIVLKRKKHTQHSAPLDAEILLSLALKKPKEFLHSYSEFRLSPAQEKSLKKLVQRRLRGEPIAYITGKKEFYGREFFVNRSVLIPRPETETIIEEISHLDPLCSSIGSKLKIADIGSGSGCIAITLKEIYPHAEIFATDSSKKAIKILKKNASLHCVNIKIFHGDLFAPLKNIKPNILVANLPYLNRKKIKIYKKFLPYEPSSSLYSGDKGLAHYKRLLCQMQTYKIFPRLVLLEIDPKQKKQLTAYIKNLLPEYNIHFQKDLLGNTRILILSFSIYAT